MNLADQPELASIKNDKFVQDLNSIINSYNKSKHSFSTINNLQPETPNQCQHSNSTFFSQTLNSKISHKFGNMTTNITAVNSLLDNYKSERRHLNNLSLSFFTSPYSGLNNLQTNYSRFNPFQFSQNQPITTDQRLKIQA